jgi:hypothetical protein
VDLRWPLIAYFCNPLVQAKFVIVKALYPLLLNISVKFRLFLILQFLYSLETKYSGARGTFTCSRLLVLVVEPSFSPEKAWLQIACFRKAKTKVSLKFTRLFRGCKPRGRPFFYLTFPQRSVIVKALYPLLLYISAKVRLYLRFTSFHFVKHYKTPSTRVSFITGLVVCC